ncbi:formate/nitrite transporter family protein [Mesobacillus subterraneus]|uniref:formate/nitrite transporter family protein n=1 Tax=Mesobacillus subterraneus TaxID=285983 RepID=UPI002040AA7B|nr:formate/nitrite transporter family protein [Mesobacillus subterraneus]MCM3664245.1 formate/nitrite transporter family protein [Mesobacillus subterraneus]MCM3682273.1 formate/nitrite transporter family protein [Mesobacillus subterraneus]
MNEQPIEQAIKTAIKKKDYLMESKMKYLLRAALAGVYIGFGIMVSYRLGEYFFDSHSPATPIAGSIFFGIALVLILYGGGELFTSNTMMMTISSLKKATTWKDTIENWIACYAGNLLGAVFFAVIIMLSGIFSSPEKTQYMMETVSMKMNTPAYQLFFRAILCNWLVCLAVWVPLNIKGDGAKIGVMMLLVFAFVVSGFEHSVANMVLFSIALFVPHPETVSLAAGAYSLLPVTAGNIIGGAFFVGTIYVYLSVKPSGAVYKSHSTATKSVYGQKVL